METTSPALNKNINHSTRKELAVVYPKKNREIAKKGIAQAPIDIKKNLFCEIHRFLVAERERERER